jgi:4a-hydroxytetrahydrobiopterin dehydratase
MKITMPSQNILKDQLSHGKCVPCEGGTAPLTQAEEDMYHDASPLWIIERSGVHQLVREVECKNFVTALQLINEIGKIAESQGHHPNLYLHDYKKLRIELSTLAIGGLSMNDFILAVQIDEVLQKTI